MRWPPLYLTVPADHAECAGVRTELRSWWPSNSPRADHLDDALLIATELVSNAVAAVDRRGADRPHISMRAEHLPNGFSIEVRNEGPGFDPDALPTPSDDQACGRGIALARALGQLTVDQSGTVTSVRVERAFSSFRDLPTTTRSDGAPDGGALPSA